MKRTIIVAIVASLAFYAGAATIIWTGTGTGSWFNSANWTPAQVPTNGDNVLITNNNVGVILSGASAQLSSLTISNKASLIFTNWNSALNATNIYIAHTSSLFTLPAAFTDAPGFSNNIYIVCSNIAIKGKIDADNKGYASKCGPGAGINSLSTPYMSSYYTGAGHGGYGSFAEGRESLTNTSFGLPYDDPVHPIMPGSGNHPIGVSFCGGGAIRIIADNNVHLDGGIITANGGAGGSIYITCKTITGNNGIISARGQIGLTDGSAGGCIAVHYDTNAQALVGVPDIIFDVVGGHYNNTAAFYPYCFNSVSALKGRSRGGEHGTLHFPDNLFFQENFRHSAKWLAGSLTNLTLNKLTISNSCLKFPYDGFELYVQGDIRVMASTRNYYNLVLSNGYIRCDGNFFVSNATIVLLAGTTTNAIRPYVDIRGNLILTNNAKFLIYTGGTTNETMDYGSFIGVSNLLYVGSNCVLGLVCNPTNGSAPLISAQELYVAASVGSTNFPVSDTDIYNNQSAYIYGYAGGYQSAWWSSTDGLGPGKGYSTTIGAGHGGKGGNASGDYGQTYGNSNAPIQPGSSVPGPIGCGGGVIRIEANKANINGLLDVRVRTSQRLSAGSIFIKTKYLYGSNACFLANAPTLANGGGGGRIAILTLYNYSTNFNYDVRGAGHVDGDGTLVFGTYPLEKGAVVRIY